MSNSAPREEDSVMTETARTPLNQATVRQHAQYHGLHLVSTMRAEQQDRWWLSSSTNWVTTEPGKPLAEIGAVLDDMDGGEWAREQAEAAEQRALNAERDAAAMAEQEALRLRLVPEYQADEEAGDGESSYSHEDEDGAVAD